MPLPMPKQRPCPRIESSEPRAVGLVQQGGRCFPQSIPAHAMAFTIEIKGEEWGKIKTKEGEEKEEKGRRKAWMENALLTCA